MEHEHGKAPFEHSADLKEEHHDEVDMTNITDRKQSIVLHEGADLYGSREEAEKYGYVARGLKSRHIQFIALGGTIGTGLFLGIGSAFYNSGPLSVLLGYTLTGIAVYMMMQSLGEMVTWLPLPGAIPQYCARYVDDAMGFAAGWSNWYSCALTLCAELSAASTVIQFWNTSINVAAWISIILVAVILLNIFAVSIYGEAEFIFAAIKIVTIVGLLILAFIIDLGGGPAEGRLGFRYWSSPHQAMKQLEASGNTGRFLGLWSTLVNAAFSYGGVETVAVTGGEAENPRKNVPKAVRRVFWRILFFYVLGTLAIGVIVPSSDPKLVGGAPGARDSPWVLGIVNAGIPVLPSIINAVILTSASSAANAWLYVGSRYLFALAQNRQAPRFLLWCTKKGVPLWCVLITASIGLLTYLSCSDGASVVFGWFQSLCAITSLITWLNILVAYIFFHRALLAQGVDRNTLIFKSPFQPYMAWVALVFFSLIAIFNGWFVFTNGNWSAEGFVSDYIVIPIWFCFYGFWKIFKRCPFIKPTEADLWTGKAAIDAEIWPEIKPRNFLEKIWFWIA